MHRGSLSWRICLLIYIFRLFNCLLSRTFFQPDEYYQSLEIAHRIVFGYGYETWEWRASIDHSTGGIRSPLHPFLFVPAYWILKVLKLDHTELLIILPKFVQAGIATITDVATYSIASNLLTPAYAPAALACSLTSFFNAYAGIRTLSNSLETALTATALAYWPWTTGQTLDSWTNLVVSISIMATTIIVRPSSILFWSALLFSILKNSSGDARMDIIALFSVIGTISALACFTIDSSFYGLPTFTPMNFIRQNVMNNLSSFYGMNSWHFYFTQAFTFVNLSLFPAVILGMISLTTPQSIYESTQALIKLRSARFSILSTMIGLSFLKHKEFRFIQPLIPLFNCFAARVMVNNYIKFRERNPIVKVNQVNPIERLLLSRSLGFIFRSIISFSLAFYLLRFHYHAQVSVMSFLRQIPIDQLKSVGFLMPCHSTPWQSHLHRPHLASDGIEERLWMLTCEPPLIPIQKRQNPNNATGEEQSIELNGEEYRDETEEFYDDSLFFLQTRFPKQVDASFPGRRVKADMMRSFEWPSHLVMFESLWNLSQVQGHLVEKGYQIIWSGANSRWHDDPARRSGHVLVLEYSHAL